MADDNKVRTSIILDQEDKEAFEAEGSANKRGWTVEMVILAKEGLAARQEKVGRKK